MWTREARRRQSDHIVCFKKNTWHRQENQTVNTTKTRPIRSQSTNKVIFLPPSDTNNVSTLIVPFVDLMAAVVTAGKWHNGKGVCVCGDGRLTEQRQQPLSKQ